MAKKNYKILQYERQVRLMHETDVFHGDTGYGKFAGKPRPFVLKLGDNNFYENIVASAKEYFSDNGIAWWRGSLPTGHTLSSQIACLNHLFPIMYDYDAVLAIINGIRNEFVEVLPVAQYRGKPVYIDFEVISYKDYLNEKYSTRGSNCTSVDAVIMARHKDGRKILIPIEWKYTEFYYTLDKSTEDGDGNAKGSEMRGRERLERYTELINANSQLKHLASYRGSVYYQEPFYQLMRQTLWAQAIIDQKDEPLNADDYWHLHIIPAANAGLLYRKYKASGMNMEDTWRSMLTDQSKYTIVDPSKFLGPIKDKYPELCEYLRLRYW